MLRNEPPKRPLLGWIGAVLLCGVAVLALRPVLTWVLPVALLVSMTAVAAIGRHLSRRHEITLECDGRTLQVGRHRAVNLLDIDTVYAEAPYLWIQMRPGPLQDVRIGPFRESSDDLQSIEEILRVAVSQADRRRGDAPDQRYHEMQRLLEKQVSPKEGG